MNLNFPNQSLFRTCLTLLLISVLSSCGTRPTLSFPTSTSVPSQPTEAKPATTSDGPSLFKAGLDYLDIAVVLKDAGHETLSLDLRRDEATAQVTMEPPTATRVHLEKIDSIWQIQP
jgi:hypothetical protein